MSKDQNTKKLINDSIINDISDAIEKLYYGTVIITVHNRKIAQVEVAKKERFDDVWKLDEGVGI